MKTENIHSIISALDDLSLQITETDVLSALSKVDPNSLSEKERVVAELENMTFILPERYNWNNCKEEPWGTYFGPIFASADGKTYPALESINKETVDYWHGRMGQVQHPVLKARYAGLVYDFCKINECREMLFPAAKAFVESCILMSESHLHKYEFEEMAKLKRALEVSISVRDSKLINLVKYQMLTQLSERVCLSSVEFMLDKRRTIMLSADETLILTKTLKEHCNNRCLDTSLRSSLILSNYYKAMGKKSEAKTSISDYIAHVIQRCDNERPMWQKHFLEEALSYGKNYGVSGDIMENATLKLREANANLHKDMHKIQVSVPIDFREIDEMIDEACKHDSAEVLKYLATGFIPNKQNAINIAEETRIKHPMTHTFNRKILGPDSQTSAHSNVGENNFISQYVQLIQINMPVLARYIEKTVGHDKVNIKACEDWFAKSEIYSENHRKQLSSGLCSYFNGDLVAAIYVLVPQFECAIRELLNLTGTTKLKSKHSGGLDEESLGKHPL